MSVWVDRRTDPAALASGDNTILTVDAGHTVRTNSFHIVNTSTTTNLVVKIGINSSADANLITPSVTIPKKQMIDYVAAVTLLENDLLVVNASASGITLTCHYSDLYPHL